MKPATDLGMNRTGMGMAPMEGKSQEENSWQAVPSSPGDSGALARLREEYAAEAEPVGSVPPPTTVKGLAKTALQMGMGHKPAALIDKIGERLAFERTGTRLYELLIGKFMSGESPTGKASLEMLSNFRDQELAHFHMLWGCLEALGADPTVQTPCADLAGVKATGLLQAMADPRTTFAQSLDAMLVAELSDNDSWRILISIAEGMGQQEMADMFIKALIEEDIHLEHTRGWVADLAMTEAKVEPEITA